MVRCHEMSQIRPTITLVDAIVTATRYQGTAPDRVTARESGKAMGRSTVTLIARASWASLFRPAPARTVGGGDPATLSLSQLARAPRADSGRRRRHLGHQAVGVHAVGVQHGPVEAVRNRLVRAVDADPVDVEEVVPGDVLRVAPDA